MVAEIEPFELLGSSSEAMIGGRNDVSLITLDKAEAAEMFFLGPNSENI